MSHISPIPHVSLFFTVIVLFFHINPGSSTALTVYDTEADFLNNTPITSTETFSRFTQPTTFDGKLIFLDGTAYCTTDRTNVAWTVTQNGNFGSNAIGVDVLSFGPGRYVLAIGLLFTGDGGSPPNFAWQIIVNEIDGTNTTFSLSSSYPNTLVAYRGFLSDIGIKEIIVRDDPTDSGAGNWRYDNVSHSAVLLCNDTDVCSESGLCNDDIRLAQRCQQTIGREGAKFMQRVFTARRRCLDRQQEGRIPLTVDCRYTPTGDTRTDRSLTGAETELNRRLERSCRDGFSLEALKFPGLCLDQDEPPFLLEDLQSCLLDAHSERAEELIDYQYPPE